MNVGVRVAACVLVATLCGGSAAAAGVEACAKKDLATIGSGKVQQVDGTTPFFFQGGLAIDADGAPNAYHPDDTGLDWLANAGKTGNWYGIVTGGDGVPAVQGKGDPFPGYYISPTSLQDATKSKTDPARYVDSSTIPFIVLPPGLQAAKLNGGAKLGDFAAVLSGGTIVYAIVADTGPRDKLGEGSIALAEKLGIASNPKRGGAASGVRYRVFPGSGNGSPRTKGDIEREGEKLLKEWGGSRKLKSCL